MITMKTLRPARLRRAPNDAEYILISSIEPRLYLATRLIMDIAQSIAK
jgi:hypothetical protein